MARSKVLETLFEMDCYKKLHKDGKKSLKITLETLDSQGLLKNSDLQNLALLCIQTNIYHRLNDEIAKEDISYTNSKKQIVINPALSQLNSTASLITRILSGFGGDVKSRRSINSKEMEKNEPSVLESLLLEVGDDD